MLVYLKQPMGYTSIDGKRIYGRHFCHGKFGPTDIPRKLYKKNIDILEEVEYNKEILEEYFPGVFPNISFKISKLYKLSNDEIVELAHALGIDFIYNRNKKMPTIVRRGLSKAVVRALTD